MNIFDYIGLIMLGVIAGAFSATLYMDSRSPILYDRLVVAGLGGLMGLVFMILMLGSVHFATALGIN